jgi:hypothetical protein
LLGLYVLEGTDVLEGTNDTTGSERANNTAASVLVPDSPVD